MKQSEHYKEVLPSKIFEDLCTFYQSSGKDLPWQSNESGRERVSVTIKDKYLVKQVVL
jgi:adenine-specific DNA glycosylase